MVNGHIFEGAEKKMGALENYLKWYANGANLGISSTFDPFSTLQH